MALLGKRKRQGDEAPRKTTRPLAPGSTVKSAVKATPTTTKSGSKSVGKTTSIKSTAGKSAPGKSGTKSASVKATLKPAASQSKEDEEESDSEDLRAIFQRAFEAKFKPIEIKKVEKARAAVEEDEDEEDEEEFGGLSEDEDEEEEEDDEDGDGGDEDEIEVVELADIRRRANDGLDKKQMKAFMVCEMTSSRTLITDTPHPPAIPQSAAIDVTSTSHTKSHEEKDKC